MSLLQEEEFLEIATAHYDKLKNWKADNYAYDWDNKSPALHILFNQIAPSEETKCASCPHLPDTKASRCMRTSHAGRWGKSPSLSWCPAVVLLSGLRFG